MVKTTSVGLFFCTLLWAQNLRRENMELLKMWPARPNDVLLLAGTGNTGGNKLTGRKGERKMEAIGYNCIGMMWESPNFPTKMRL